MIKYGLEDVKIRKFEAKIKFENSPSLAMFRKLGFQEVGRSDVFEEITLAVTADDSWKGFIDNECIVYKKEEYRKL